MKLLVFAHIPPPHHGQSYMVKLMLDGFGGDRRRRRTHNHRDPRSTQYGIDCYHVNVRLSRDLADIGDLRPSKLFVLIWRCLEAIWCRFRHGVTTLYYIPAPGKYSALWRDWVVMALCRPFLHRVILHWHAAGLGKWLETCSQAFSRSTTYRSMGGVDLSIVLSQYNRADAEKLWPQRICAVSNGIPDPCPDFDEEILPLRLARLAARRELPPRAPSAPEALPDLGGDPQNVRVLYLAHCTAEKGLFDALEGVRRANRVLAERGSVLRLRLHVAGDFLSDEEHREFERLRSAEEVQSFIQYHGFVSGEMKDRLLREADLFCFPTYFSNENQPVNIIEAQAYGVPVITTFWRSLPEALPEAYPWLVAPRDPDQLAARLIKAATAADPSAARQHFLRHFVIERHLSNLARAIQDAGKDSEVDAHHRAGPSGANLPHS